MAKPERDCAQVHAMLQQAHGDRISQRVRRYEFFLE
jgi:hypothetical protein